MTLQALPSAVSRTRGLTRCRQLPRCAVGAGMGHRAWASHSQDSWAGSVKGELVWLSPWIRVTWGKRWGPVESKACDLQGPGAPLVKTLLPTS